MFLPFSAPLYHHIAPDTCVVIDERKMSLAVLKVAEFRLNLYFSHPLFKRALRIAYQPSLHRPACAAERNRQRTRAEMIAPRFVEC